MRPDHQRRVLAAWELAVNKTGGYLYSRMLLAIVSTLFHWIVFQAAGIEAPIPLALWVSFVSQFLPVVGTYIAGVLPVAIAFIDSPVKALVVLGFVVYQQLENYFFAPRGHARTMECIRRWRSAPRSPGSSCWASPERCLRYRRRRCCRLWPANGVSATT